MADNVNMTAGSGTGGSLRLDEVGGQKYQVVKIATGADNTAYEEGTSTETDNFSTNTTTAGHTADDAVSNSTTTTSVTPLTWTMGGGRGVIRRCRVKFTEDGQTPRFRIWLFTADVDPGAGDNSPWGTSTDLANCIGIIDVNLGYQGNDEQIGFTQCDIPFEAATLYGLVQILDTITTTAQNTLTCDLTYIPG